MRPFLIRRRGGGGNLHLYSACKSLRLVVSWSRIIDLDLEKQGSKQMKNHLRLLRNQRKLSQIAVQIETGIDQALLSKYERGERIPPTDTLMVLADYFQTSTDFLLGRTDVREPYPPSQDSSWKNQADSRQ